MTDPVILSELRTKQAEVEAEIVRLEAHPFQRGSFAVVLTRAVAAWARATEPSTRPFGVLALGARLLTVMLLDLIRRADRSRRSMRQKIALWNAAQCSAGRAIIKPPYPLRICTTRWKNDTAGAGS